MPVRTWLLVAVLALGFADVTRADTLKSKFRCSGMPDSQITLSVKIEDDTQATTMKWKGKNLGANASVNCGYDCLVLGSTRFSFCSPADAAGKWKYVDVNPTPSVCIGMFPRVTLLPANVPCYLQINP
jgi:hypothetical protein